MFGCDALDTPLNRSDTEASFGFDDSSSYNDGFFYFESSEYNSDDSGVASISDNYGRSYDGHNGYVYPDSSGNNADHHDRTFNDDQEGYSSSEPSEYNADHRDQTFEDQEGHSSSDSSAYNEPEESGGLTFTDAFGDEENDRQHNVRPSYGQPNISRGPETTSPYEDDEGSATALGSDYNSTQSYDQGGPGITQPEQQENNGNK
ncbi:RNA polymerase-associated protein LEO1-like [Cheilinus undulatus]|uniref:RNA polymerase-associated protein LEO1-like n=1 Tax=Cheilinus undulatus TaxID=241271 RepID=UPI001BD46CF9|nr:RNA polymerase-associated protein LEO1-like [Cheilinus undulatus]